MPSLKKRLKKKLGDLVPDPLEHLAEQAREYLSDPTRVARDVGERAMQTRFLGAASPADVRRAYDATNRRVTDPVREVALTAAEEDLDPFATARRIRERSTQPGGLGGAFRARENTLAKRVTENIVDPFNLIPFGGVGVAVKAGRAAGLSPARATLKALATTVARELVTPAVGQVVGAEIGREVGGERGAQIGELAGLLGGAFGPNLVGGRRAVVPETRAVTAGTGIVPREVARVLPGDLRLPESADFRRAVARTPGAQITADGLELDLVRWQKRTQAGEPSARTGVFYLPLRAADAATSRYAASGTSTGGSHAITGRSLYRAPLVLAGPDTGVVPARAIDALQGDGTAAGLRRDLGRYMETAFRGRRSLARTAQITAELRQILARHGGDPDQAGALLATTNRKRGPFVTAVQEHVAARAARTAGYDSIVGVADGRLSEVFDVREARYPTPEGGYALNPAAVGRTPRGVVGITPDTDRFYHGTASAFDRPEPGRFDPNGLFGPGYYLTDDPRVASSYSAARATLSPDYARRIQEAQAAEAAAQQRLARAEAVYNETGRLPGVADDAATARLDELRREARRTRDEAFDLIRRQPEAHVGHQVRPVDVPRGLRLFDIEGPVSQDEIERIIDAYPAVVRERWQEKVRLEYANDPPAEQQRELDWLLNSAEEDFAYLNRRLRDTTDSYPGASPNAVRERTGLDVYEQLEMNALDKVWLNRLLHRLGYDGIRYSGGQRIPLRDDAGKAIEHTAVVVFPESLDKLTNALSGTPGGLLPASRGLPAGIASLTTEQLQRLSPEEQRALARQIDVAAAARARPAREIFELNRAGLAADIPAAAAGAAGNVAYQAAVNEETSPREIARNALVGAGMGVSGRRVRALMRDTLPQAAGAVGEGAPPQRFYHGTGSAFDRPRGEEFKASGLFGPAYYLTSDPRVAADYGMQRSKSQGWQDVSDDDLAQAIVRWQRKATELPTEKQGALDTILAHMQEEQAARAAGAVRTGPNIRPIDVPGDLNLLDADKPVDRGSLRRIVAAAQDSGVRESLEYPHYSVKAGQKADHIYSQLVSAIQQDLNVNHLTAQARANDILASAGYDGIRYDGGRRMPMLDAKGKPIRHEAIAIFSQSLSKIRNALSGTEGGTAIAANALQLGGTAAGAAGGYQATEGEDWRTRALATLGGGLAGAALGRRVAQGKGIGLGIEDVSGAPSRIGRVTASAAATDTSPATLARLRTLAGGVLGLPRQLLLMGDLGQLARIGVGGFLQSLSTGQPHRGAAAYARAFRAAFDPGYFRELMARPEYQRWAGLAYPEDMSNPEFQGTLIRRLPGLGHAERAMFERFTPALAAGVAETVFTGVKNAGDFRHMANDAARRAVIGDWVKGLLVGRELNDAAVGTVARAVGRIALAPRWTAGGIVGVQKILDPGAEGELARRFWATVALTGAATSVGLTAYFTHKDPRDLINPDHPDSVLNPRNGRRFLGVELPGGTVVSPFQPVTPLVRALLRPFAEGYATYTEEREIGAAVEAMLGEGWDAGRDYLLGKANILVRMANDIVIRNTDFQGRPIRTKEGLAGLGQAVGYAVSQNAPIVTQPLIEPIAGRLSLPGDLGREPRVPGTELTWGDRLAEFGAGFFGVTVRPPDRLPDEVAAGLRAAITAKGQTPGAEPDLLGQYFRLNLDPSERARLEREHPAVRDFFAARTRLEGEKYEKPAGRARVREYQTKKARLDEERRAALVELEQEHLTGNEYRRRRSAVMDRYRGMVQGLQEAIFDTADPDRIAAAMDAVYRTGGERSAERQALDGLYAIQPEGETREQRDAYFAARRAYLESLSPEMRETLFQTQLDEAPTDTERAYIHAQRAMDAYQQIPTYRGFTVEESKEANAVIGRARDLLRFRPNLTTRRAILLDREADAATKRRALLALSGKRTNPARRRFFMSQPLFARFYSDLSLDTAEEILARSG